LFKNTTLRHIAGTDKERQKQVLDAPDKSNLTPTISSSTKGVRLPDTVLHGTAQNNGGHDRVRV
jgi:hypothetical protein